MSQSLQSAQNYLVDLERQKMDLEQAHQSKKQEIYAAGQRVPGLVIVKLLQDLNAEIRKYEQELQIINGKIMNAKANIQMLRK